MRRSVLAGSWAWVWLVAGISIYGGTSGEQAYLAEPLAEGVTLFRSAHRAGANSLVVEQEQGLVVVDSQPTPEAGRELLSAIAARFARPVRHLVLSHAHAEAAGGASAFADGTVIIASAGAAAELDDPAHDFGAEIQARSRAPETWVAPPLRRPGMVITCRSDLTDATRPIQLLPQGPAHTQGDLFVYLPEQDVLYIGGLLATDRNPYAKGGSLEGWAARLNDVLRLGPAKVVGVSGPAVGPEDVARQRDALIWLRGQVEEAFVRGIPVADLRQTVLEAQGIEARFPPGASPSFLALLVDQAIDEGLQHRRKRGIQPN